MIEHFLFQKILSITPQDLVIGVLFVARYFNEPGAN